jgi:hypothetical protein
MPHAPWRPKDCSPDFPAFPARPGYLSETCRGGRLKVSRGLSAFGGVARRGSAPSVFVPAATAIYAVLCLKSKTLPRARLWNPQVSADRGRIGLNRLERESGGFCEVAGRASSHGGHRARPH